MGKREQDYLELFKAKSRKILSHSERNLSRKSNVAYVKSQANYSNPRNFNHVVVKIQAGPKPLYLF